MSKTIRVRLLGCDDTTNFTIAASEAEYAFLRRLCEASKKASTYGCMPTMGCQIVKAPSGEGQADG